MPMQPSHSDTSQPSSKPSTKPGKKPATLPRSQQIKPGAPWRTGKDAKPAARSPLAKPAPQKPTPCAEPRYSPTTAPTKAMPTAVCRLENTQLMAEGQYTCRTSARGVAPSIRALATSSGFTSFTP